MILELKLLGFRLVLTPKTVEALLDFATRLFSRRPRGERSASSDNKLT
jgi:hypothetical protein